MTTNSPNQAARLWVEPSVKKLWVDPEISELSVSETFAQPGAGADVGGNPFPDCQAS
jgi:hypothetical protein